MKFTDILGVVDYEQAMKVCIENKGALESEVSGDQASIKKMLSGKMFDSDVSCIEAREGRVLYVWLEAEKDEDND